MQQDLRLLHGCSLQGFFPRCPDDQHRLTYPVRLRSEQEAGLEGKPRL